MKKFKLIAFNVHLITCLLLHRNFDNLEEKITPVSQKMIFPQKQAHLL